MDTGVDRCPPFSPHSNPLACPQNLGAWVPQWWRNGAKVVTKGGRRVTGSGGDKPRSVYVYHLANPSLTAGSFQNYRKFCRIRLPPPDPVSPSSGLRTPHPAVPSSRNLSPPC